jgi:hypothetical protein
LTRDEIIKRLLDEGAIRVDLERGLVFSNRRHPDRPLGSLDRYGYLKTSVYYQGKPYYVLVHRIGLRCARAGPTGGTL